MRIQVLRNPPLLLFWLFSLSAVVIAVMLPAPKGSGVDALPQSVLTSRPPVVATSTPPSIISQAAIVAWPLSVLLLALIQFCIERRGKRGAQP